MLAVDINKSYTCLMVSRFKAEVAWIGLGSNLGDKMKNLTQAAMELSVIPASSLLVCSSVYKTEPVGKGYSSEFYNAVVGVLTGMSPGELLAECMRIELELGRDRSIDDRLIDIDILLFSDQIIATRGLVVPHPKMEERRFVLEPLVEVAPKVVHPIHQVEVYKLMETKLMDQPVEKIDRPLLPALGC